MTEFRHVLRGLRRAPGFTLVAAATLAVGIGVNVSVYALIDAVLFRPLTPFEPYRVVRLATTSPGNAESTRFAFAYADYRDIRESSRTLEDVAASSLTPFVLRVDDGASEILGEIVSASYFTALKLSTSRGRALEARDDDAGAPPAAMLSGGAAARHFADRDPVGAVVHLNGSPFTVVGIMPETFGGTFVGAPIDAWVPIEVSDQFFAPDWRTSRSQTSFSMLARLAPGATREQAQAELDTLSVRLREQDPVNRASLRVLATSGDLLRGQQRRGAAMFAAVLAILVGLVLLIVCANVANLLLARGVGLRRQMAIRLALGAGRARIIRLVLLESLVLSALGGVGAVAIASVVIDALTRFDRLPTLTIELGLRLDNGVLAAAGAIALVAGLVLGITPALHASRPEVQSALRDETSTSTAGRTAMRMRHLLVVAQVAVSLLLMGAAGLFLRSLENARALDLGFEPSRALAIDVDVSSNGIGAAEAHRLYDELRRRLEARPDVEGVAFSNRAPVDISTPAVDVLLDGAGPAPGQAAPQATMYLASPRYFEAIDVPILHGRPFRDGDNATAPPVAIVNETMARRFWKGPDAIGQRFKTAADGDAIEIVGIARNSRYRTPGEAPQSHVYLAFAQNDGQSATVIVRAAGDPRPLVPVVQRELERLPTPLQGFFGRTLREHLAIYLLPSELAAVLSGVLGTIALVVAAIGLYGVIAYMVGQRTPEIAVRMALGAAPSSIRAMVMGGGLRVLVPGLAIGAIGTLAVGRLASSFLYGVGLVDPPTLLAAMGVLSAAVLLASYLPARRAMRIDPIAALRR